MEIYAAAKREQRASLNKNVTQAKKETSSSSGGSTSAAKVEQFEQTKKAMSALEEQVRAADEKFRQAMARRAADQLEEQGESKSELEAMGEKLKIMQRCQEIARRLMRGDRVPPQDEQYLMTNDPEGYKLALAMRKPKPNPKEWESVLEDIQGAETTESTDAEGTATAEASYGGGDRGDGDGGEGGEGGADSADGG